MPDETRAFLDSDGFIKSRPLRAEAKPFKPRFGFPLRPTFPESDQPFQLPMLPARKKENDYFQIESTTIHCSYCLTTHQGPHCYRGGCDNVEAITSSENSFTKSICFQCGGRHISSNEDDRNDQVIFCKLCQRRHQNPKCEIGSCTSVQLEPYVCDIDHEQRDCNNVTCLLFQTHPAIYKQNNPSKHICANCGGRHLPDLKHTPPESVECGYCRKRHAFPNCLVGSCTSLGTIRTPLYSSKYLPLQYPLSRRICSRCGRRHLQNKYSSHYYKGGSFPTISCLSCGEGHPPPACFEGKCGDALKNNQIKCTRKYLCNICGRRHQPKPQHLDSADLDVDFIQCNNCSCKHEPGPCHEAEACEDVKPFRPAEKRSRVATKLNCHLCNHRHIDMAGLIQKSEPKELKIISSAYQVGFSFRDLALASRPKPDEPVIPDQPDEPDPDPLEYRYCKTCHFTHKLPFCSVEARHFEFCPRCKVPHAQPRCTITTCSANRIFNTLRQRSLICKNCLQRHVKPGETSNVLTFKEWWDLRDTKDDNDGDKDNIDSIDETGIRTISTPKKDKLSFFWQKIGFTPEELVYSFLPFIFITLFLNFLLLKTIL